MRILGSFREKITLDNITNAFPEKDMKWHNKLVKESYRNLGITFLETADMRYFTDEDIEKLIKFENVEVINEAHKKGKGVLLLSGHYGNWELVAYAGAMYSRIPFLIPIHPQKNRYIDEQLNKTRTRGGNTIIPMGNAAKPIVTTLLKGGIVALLADQAATYDKDVFVDFFGRQAATYVAPASLALRYDVPVLMGFAERQEDGTYLVRMLEVKKDDLELNDEGIKELTQRHVKVLEEQIHKKPEQWAWQHRRWKHNTNEN